jgi:hypothetical protein
LPLECSDGKVMTAMNLASSSERFKGDRPPHLQEKNIRLVGALFAVDPTTMRLTLELVCGNGGPFLVAVAMVMGGVVDRWPWCLRHHKPYK